MAETTTEPNSHTEHGFKKLKEHIILNKINFMMWVLRGLSILFIIGYFIPIFWKPYDAYYQALMANVGINALRLHQRLPTIQFTIKFLFDLLMEDSFHYLLYSAIFFPLMPMSLVLQPIFLFSLLHLASYSLTILDTLGQNAWWCARLFISIVEVQSRNILRLISCTEILLMFFTVILIFFGRANLLTVLLYYQFLSLRYSSRRNPYTRNLFHELRLLLEDLARKPGVPHFIQKFLLTIVMIASQLPNSYRP